MKPGVKKVLRRLRSVLRRAGLEVQLCNVQSSDAVKLGRLLSYHRIDLVLDVGANTGQYGQLLRAVGYSGRIVSFEPLSRAHAQLVRASSRDRAWTVAPQAAIGDDDGWVDINVAANSYSSSLLPVLSTHLRAAPESRTITTERVRLARLDSIASVHADGAERVFLKVDTQGYEDRVLAGALEIVGRATGVQLELSLVPLYAGQTLMSEMVGWMQDHGFELHGLFPGFAEEESGRLLQVDGVFFRRTDSRRFDV